jgi:hypothetical protein
MAAVRADDGVEGAILGVLLLLLLLAVTFLLRRWLRGRLPGNRLTGVRPVDRVREHWARWARGRPAADNRRPAEEAEAPAEPAAAAAGVVGGLLEEVVRCV